MVKSISTLVLSRLPGEPKNALPTQTFTERAIAFFSVAIGAIFFVSTTYAVYENYSPVPFWDQWFGGIGWYMRSEEHWWQEFWSQHNEHRILYSRLFFWIDIRYFGGKNVIDLVANVGTCAMMALAFLLIIMQSSSSKRGDTRLILGIAFALCFSWMQKGNFTWGFQSQWFAVDMFALFTFYGVQKTKSGRSAPGWIAFSVMTGVCAMLSMANGLLALPVALIQALIVRSKVRYQLLILAATILAWVSYFWQKASVISSTPNGNLRYAIAHSPSDLLQWTLSYLGSPLYFEFGSRMLAIMAGLVVVIGLAVGTLGEMLSKDRKHTGMLAMTMFMVATALITAGGRLPFGVSNVFQDRYATNGILALLSSSLMLLNYAPGEKTRAWLYGVFTVPLIGAAIAQLQATSVDRTFLFNQKVAAAALRVGALGDEDIKVLSDPPQYLRSIVPRAKAEGLSIFQSPLDATHDLPISHDCRGAIDEIHQTSTPGFYEAQGWFYDPVHGDIPSEIVIVDDDGRIVGEGVTGIERPDVSSALGSPLTRFGWKGYFFGSKTNLRAADRSGQHLCGAA